MTILGIESIAYGVADLDGSIRFFEDFGLPLGERSGRGADFALAEGSRVRIRAMDDPSLPKPFAQGPGLRELVWGVDSEATLDRLATDLGRDRALTLDNDGTIHTNDDAGLAIGFRVYRRTPPQDPPQAENGLAQHSALEPAAQMVRARAAAGAAPRRVLRARHRQGRRRSIPSGSASASPT